MPVVHELHGAIAEADRKASEARGIALDAKAEISAHERECVLRYVGINTALGEIKTSLAQDRAAIAAERARFGKFVWSLVGSIALLVASMIGWLMVQLYTLEPLRVQAQEHKTAAAISTEK